MEDKGRSYKLRTTDRQRAKINHVSFLRLSNKLELRCKKFTSLRFVVAKTVWSRLRRERIF